MQLIGVDFTSAPSRRKPIVVARGHLRGAALQLERLSEIHSLDAFETLLLESGPWLGAFDFPFGLPREFVASLGLGATTAELSRELHRRCATRMEFRAMVDAWGNGRAPGQRLVHRATDTALPGVSSTSPLQTRYVPVGFMYYEGVERLLRCGVTMVRQHEGDPSRLAVEAYPGLLAHELIGSRSYKNKDDAERLIARKDMVDALEQGRTRLGLRLRLSHAQRDALAADASGDRLDAVLCLAQAAWVSSKPGYGLPAAFDMVEGWISTA